MCRRDREAVGVTQQYIVGEMSLLLARLQAVSTNPKCSCDIARLRHETETGPLAALGSVASRALELTDGLSWMSLCRGDGAAFWRQATVAAELREFGECACLIDDG